MSTLPNDQDLLAYFEAQIKKEGQKDLHNLLHQIETQIKEKKQEIETQLATKYQLKLELMKVELKHQFDQQVREYETFARQQVGSKRSESIQHIFHQVESKLTEFCLSDDYRKWIITSLNPFLETMKDDTVIITMKPGDTVIPMVIKNHDITCTLVEDASIRWGGFYLQFSTNKFRYDVSIDSRWKDVQKQYFDRGNSL